LAIHCRGAAGPFLNASLTCLFDRQKSVKIPTSKACAQIFPLKLNENFINCQISAILEHHKCFYILSLLYSSKSRLARQPWSSIADWLNETGKKRLSGGG
jgi:hypothetical protein